MKTLLFLVLWAILFLLCWPIALLIVILFPIVWLIALPFRLAFMVVESCLALLRAILFLPARLLGYRAS